MAIVTCIFIPIIIIMCILIPVMIGIYVYKDAKNRQMNAALWTIVAAFAPGFIGLIIYLIVRSDYSAMKCPACGAGVRESFAVCPKCGTSLKNTCSRCGYPLEGGWLNCPNCAEPIPPEKQMPTVSAHESDKALRRILAAAIIIPLVLCILLFSCVFVFRANTSNFYTSCGISGTKSDFPQKDIQAWFDRCDKAGKGIYLFTQEFEPSDTGNRRSAFLFYRNDSDYCAQISDVNHSMFKKSSVDFEFAQNDEIDGDCSVSFYCIETKRGAVLGDVIGINGQEIHYNTDAQESDLDLFSLYQRNFGDTSQTEPVCLYLEVEVPEETENIESISCTLFLDGEAVQTEATENADGASFMGTAAFAFSPDDYEFDSFSFSAIDTDGKEVYKSKTIKTDGDETLHYKLVNKENGKLAAVSDE
ncbi:MAG: zinc ribbon domain-containing protein [Acutalibacteraceae bacterium]